MSAKYMTFSNTSEFMIRVAFDEDGTPWYCCVDVAGLIGYRSSDTAIDNACNIEHIIQIEFRNVSWRKTSGPDRRTHTSRVRVFDEANARTFLSRAKPNDAVRWFFSEVVPTAVKHGQEVAKEAEENRKKALAEKKVPEPVAASAKSFVERLDAVIMECLLLKQEFMKST